jgi:hypothetical protein
MLGIQYLGFVLENNAIKLLLGMLRIQYPSFWPDPCRTEKITR